MPLQDTDNLIVGRGIDSYKITYEGLKEKLEEDGLGGGVKPVEPAPGDVTASPVFEGGTGTQADPYMITSETVAPAGETETSNQELTITGEVGAPVIFTDLSTRASAGSRFAQPVGIVGADGTWVGRLVYTDTPATTVDSVYTGNLQIGTVYFRWVITQNVSDAEINQPTVVAPPDGAGIGGDVDFFPKTSAIVAVDRNGAEVYETDSIVTVSPDSPSAGQTTLTLSGDTDLDYFRVGDVVQDGDITGDWSSMLTGGSFGDRAYNAFDGDLTTYHTADIGGTAVFTPVYNGTKGIKVENQVEFQLLAYRSTSNPSFKVNGLEYGTTIGTAGTNISGPISFVVNTITSLDEVQWQTISGSGSIGVYAIIVDGVTLIDNNVTDSRIRVTNIDDSVPSITVDGGDWSGTDGSGDPTGEPTVTKSEPFEAKLTLTNSNTYDLDTGADMGLPISQSFTAGQTVKGQNATGTYGTETAAFSTTLYSGSFSEITVDTGMDNVSQNTLLWIKKRTSAASVGSHRLYTPQKLGNSSLFSDTTALASPDQDITFTSSGYSYTGGRGDLNYGGEDYVAWNFRAAPGFFDVVTYEGGTGEDNFNTSGNTNLKSTQGYSHNLGAEPGMIIVKRIDSTGYWFVRHKDNTVSSPGTNAETYSNMSLDLDGGEGTHSQQIVNWDAEKFGVHSLANLGQCVAYLFADTPGKIKCGSYTGNNGTNSIDCGFAPGWVMYKSTQGGTGLDWLIYDKARGDKTYLRANLNSGASTDNANGLSFTNNGFEVTGSSSTHNQSGVDYIYVAIAEDVTAGEFGPTGTLTADADDNGPTITLTDVTGTWEDGMEVVNDTEVTKTGPGADALEFVGSTPQDDPDGSVTAWGNATWQVSTDSGFTAPMEATKLISDPDTNQVLLESERGTITLADDTEYWVRVKYAGNTPDVESTYSDANHFKTASPAEVPGIPYEGGYFAGKINDGGTIYNLVVAPVTEGSLEGQFGGATPQGIQWKTSNAGPDTTAQSEVYGATAMLANSGTDHPMFNWCRSNATGPNGTGGYGANDNSGIGGYNDWYIPAKNELAVLYFFLKPDTTANNTIKGSNPNSVEPYTPNTNYGPGFPNQTTNALFQDGQAQAFSPSPTGGAYYWSATENPGNTIIAWRQDFSSGNQSNFDGKVGASYARAVRREPASTFGTYYYDTRTNAAFTGQDIVNRFGVDPTESNLKQLGIAELTEQPTGPVLAYVPKGDEYIPVPDQSEKIASLTSRLDEARSRLASIESDEINDDATDTALLTLLANLTQRVTDLEQSN